MVENERKKDETALVIRKKKVRYDLGVSQTVHFSLAFAGFIKSQVLHLHPSLSEGRLSPAAPQSNPPVPLLVVEGTAVKLGLNANPAGSEAPKDNPDEAVEVVGVELDVSNRSGPDGGVGIERLFPELEPEEEAPGLEASQTVHFSLADAGFIKSQVPHFHPSVCVVGSLNPAAPQSNPSETEPSEVIEVLPKPHLRGVEEEALGL